MSARGSGCQWLDRRVINCRIERAGLDRRSAALAELFDPHGVQASAQGEDERITWANRSG